MALGAEYTAKQVYYFYRTLRIVALKRKKDKTSTSFTTGMHNSGLKAAELRTEFGLNREQLVREYALALNEDLEYSDALFDQAVRCVFAHVLRDPRPP